MSNCEKCGCQMKQLFSSEYCDCDTNCLPSERGQLSATAHNNPTDYNQHFGGNLTRLSATLAAYIPRQKIDEDTGVLIPGYDPKTGYYYTSLGDMIDPDAANDLSGIPDFQEDPARCKTATEAAMLASQPVSYDQNRLYTRGLTAGYERGMHDKSERVLNELRLQYNHAPTGAAFQLVRDICNNLLFNGDAPTNEVHAKLMGPRE